MMLVILNNGIMINIRQHLGNIGNPQPMSATLFRAAGVFFTCPFGKKTYVSHLLSLFVNIWSTFDNVCQQSSIYGTAYLPTVRHCVPTRPQAIGIEKRSVARPREGI